MKRFPVGVQDEIGFTLYLAQTGRKHDHAKPLRGFGGAGILECVADFHGDTYRAVYTVSFAGAVYVLHAFMKKSRSGIATPKHEIAVIERRLEHARQHYAQWSSQQGKR